MSDSFLLWLTSNEIEKYHQVLIENDINSIDLVKTLSTDDLKELGVSLGDRKRFGLAIEKLASQTQELSEIDLLLINSLPYVIAYPLKQTLLEKHPWTRLNLFKDTFLNYLKYLGLLSASEFFNSSIKDKGMVALFHQNLTETAFGKWNHYIREVLKFLKQNNHTFFCSELVSYYEQIETGSKAVKYKGEIEFIDANGDVQLKKQEATAIGMLINFRNRYLGHGLTLDADASERLWAEYFPIFRSLLEKMDFAQAYPMLKIEDGESWILHSAEITRIENPGIKDENIWMQNPDGKYLTILPFFIVPGELAVGNTEKAKVFTYESYTGKTIKFFSPEGTEKQTSGKILERLNLLLRDKQKETPFSPDQFTKEVFFKRIEEENKILMDTLISEKKIIPGVYQPREEMEIKLREWIGARANIFIIAAEAGSGKTNLLAEIQNQYTERGYPTLLIRAGRMEKSSLSEQVAYLLNIDVSTGIQQYASIAGTQAAPTFILIDGLNEANNAEAIWQEIIDLSKIIEAGSIKFVITSRANSNADLERYIITDSDSELLYGEKKENEKGLAASAFWLTPMNMKEMKGAWENYLSKDKSRYKPLFSFDDIATFDRALYDQISNPLVLRLFLEIYNGKSLPKKGGKYLHIWQDWFNTFSLEEQTFFKLLTNEVWLKGENELLLDDLLQHEKLKSYISSDLVNAPYARMKNMGWVSRYMKDMNACIGFTIEGSLLYLLGTKLQQHDSTIDLEYIKKVLLAENKLQRSAIESFLCEQALVGDLDLITELIDDDSEQIDLCVQPLFYYLKTFGAEETVKKILENPTENDWKVLLKLIDRIDKFQLEDLYMEFLKLVMLENQLITQNEILIGLKAVAVFDKELSLKYFNKIDINLSLFQDDANLQYTLGWCENKFGRYDKALNYYERCLTLELMNSGTEHQFLTVLYNDIGITWSNKGEYGQALEFYQKALIISLKTLGVRHLIVADTYNNIGNIWSQKKDFDKALEFYEKSLTIILSARGGMHPYVAAPYSNIGFCWYGKKDYEKALEFEEKGLAIRLKILGSEHPSVALPYNNIGNIWRKKGSYDKSLGYYEKCLAIELKTLGDEHPSVASSYDNIGNVWRIKGNYVKSLEYYEKCLAIELKTLGEEHSKVASSYDNIGSVFDCNEDYVNALKYYEKCLSIELKIFGDEHPDVANSYNKIGAVLDSNKDYDNALLYYEKSLAIELKTLGSDHPSVAASYNIIGNACYNKSNYDMALEYYEKSLTIRLKYFGGEHIIVAESYNNVANAWYNKGYYDKSLGYYEKALSIELNVLGLEHPNVATSYNNIGYACFNNGEYGKSLENYEKCLAIQIKTLGQTHLNVAYLYFNIGECYENLQDFKLAIDSYKRGFFNNRKGGFPFRIALCLEHLGDKQEAINYYIQSAEIRKDDPEFGLLNEKTQEAIKNFQRLCKEVDLFEIEKIPEWLRS